MANRIPCQICHRLGHTALNRFNRMNYNYQGRHPPAQLAVMVASQNLAAIASPNHSPTVIFPAHQPSGFPALASSQWLADSGCNTHITADLSNLSVASEYSGDNHVSVGNGQNLPISHTGHGLLRTPSSVFSLSNLFYVPHIATNLLSIHQLCFDNNCTVLFDIDYFLFQDKTMGQNFVPRP